MIDLRSDTVTKPTPGMLAAMAAADVGDEQYHEDPTTKELERRMAAVLGHESALFFPTATMANQAALRAQTKPGGVLLADERTHVLVYEWGGPAIHSGLIMRGVPGERGRITPGNVWAANDPDLGPGGIIVLENTDRSSGGTIWPLDEFRAAVGAARDRGAAVHLDGARLYNAAVGAGLQPSAWSELTDSVTVCFSKGLGCPLGAVLAGSAEFIERAWESKYLFGGALRQSGVIATAMLYGLDNHIDVLAEDHARAARLAEAIGAEQPETNFVSLPDEPGLEDRLRERGVLVANLRPGWLRAVTHLDIGDDDIDAAIPVMQEVLHASA